MSIVNKTLEKDKAASKSNPNIEDIAQGKEVSRSRGTGRKVRIPGEIWDKIENLTQLEHELILLGTQRKRNTKGKGAKSTRTSASNKPATAVATATVATTKNIPPEAIALNKVKAEHRKLHEQALIGAIGQSQSVIQKVAMVLKTIGSIIKTDPRQQSKVKFPLAIMVLVIFLAKLCGCNLCREIADFYRKNSRQLQAAIPNFHIEETVSISTINRIMKKISPSEMQLLVINWYAEKAFSIAKMAKLGLQRDRPCYIRITLGFDGQEALSSFIKGKSRNHKAIITVTIFNCTLRLVVAYKTTDAKNHESEAFVNLATLVDIKGKVIVADALNSRTQVSRAILELGGIYLLCMKQNNGNKEMRQHIEAIFNREQARDDSRILKKEHTEKDHGRIDKWKVEVLPASLCDKRINCKHTGVQTIVRYTKVSTTIRNAKDTKETTDTKYYICSLPFSEETAEQILWSILDYWSIEQHHSRLDDPRVFDQDAIQSNNPVYLGNVHGVNKCSLNFIQWFATEYFDENKAEDPITFANIRKHLKEDMSVCSLLMYVNQYLSIVEQSNHKVNISSD